MKKFIFDKEYGTSWLEEVNYLKNKGIPYTFQKVNENGLSVYKYTKNCELFKALSEFYNKK